MAGAIFIEPIKKGYSLNQLEIGQKAIISGYVSQSNDPRKRETIVRLQEMGFVPRAKIMVRHRGPVGGEPLAVEVRGALMAIGKYEASLINVRPVDEGNSN